MEPLSGPHPFRHILFSKGWPPPPVSLSPNWASYSDQELLRLYQKGNPQRSNDAFCAIYNRYRLDVARYAGTCMNTEDEAKDLFADVWLEAFKKLKTFKWQEKPIRNWLTKTAKNMSRTRKRKGQREISCENVVDYVKVELELDTQQPSEDPIDHILRKESDKRVLQAISTLKNPLQKKILMAIYIKGITNSKELAQLFKEKPGTIRVNHMRALKKIKIFFD